MTGSLRRATRNSSKRKRRAGRRSSRTRGNTPNDLTESEAWKRSLAERARATLITQHDVTDDPRFLRGTLASPGRPCAGRGPNPAVRTHPEGTGKHSLETHYVCT